MGANRLYHAVTVARKGTVHWDRVWARVSEIKDGVPLNLLASYYYLRKGKDASTKQVADRSCKILRKYTGISRSLFVDSGIYSLNAEAGLPVYKYSQRNLDDLESIRQTGGDLLDRYDEYVEEYAVFLGMSYQRNLWDYAFDFDADIFLGSKQADRLHKKLLDISGIPSRKIIRVFHTAREDEYKWWDEMCRDDNYEYLAIEGGGTHGRDPRFYNPLIEKAHRFGKKAHVLAASSKDFLEQIPVDSVDSSAHNVGGRFGQVYTPYGMVSFSKYRIGKGEFEYQDEATQEKLIEYFRKYGFDIEDLKHDEFNRKIMNIVYMNKYWDVPFRETDIQMDLFRDDIAI